MQGRVDPNIAKIAFGRPVPGQSWGTHPPKSMPWQKPPQFVQLDDACNWLFDRVLEPIHMKQLLTLMQAHMSIEAIARTLLFTGFTLGKWTPSLMMLMHKPVLLMLIAIAHKAGLSDTPVVFPDSFHKYHRSKLALHQTAAQHKAILTANKPENQFPPEVQEMLSQEEPQEAPNAGFMQRPGDNT